MEIQQIARKAYYTAITQTDAQVGRVLDALDAIGHEKDTIVVVSAGECRHSSLTLRQPVTFFPLIPRIK